MIKKINLIGLVMFSFLVSACTDVKLWAVNAPVDVSTAQIRSDLVFDEAHDLALDLYFPKNIDGKPPLIVFYYGGRWSDGKKEDYKFVAAHLIEKGYVVAIPDYRKYPQVKFPAFINDGAKAVQWLSANAGQYSYDASHIILMGHSAGAHTAALLAYDQHYLQQAEVDLKNIKAMIGLSGPYHFTPKARDLKDIFGPPENYPNMQVSNFVTAGAPPALLIYGEKDDVVARFNVERLEAALNKQNVPVTVEYYSDLDHVGTIATLTWVKKEKSSLPGDIEDFLKNSGLSR